MTKYKPERDLPEFAREYKTMSPSKLAAYIVARRNEEVDPSAITHWFTRHPDIEEQLRKELIQGLPTETQIVDASIFQNGHFQELPSVKQWILEMSARELAPATMYHAIGSLKQVCQGKFDGHNLDFVSRGKWCLKHPDRLHLNEAMEMLLLLKEQGVDTTRYKSALKDFLTSKGEVVGKKIAVGRSKSYGKYAKLYVPLETVVKMLEWIKTQSFPAYVADLFMFKTATRLSATMTALLKRQGSREGLRVFGDHAEITVYDKGRKSKYPDGHPWDKRIDAELLKEIETLTFPRTEGLIFEGLTDEALAKVNRKAIQMFALEVLREYPDLMPNHFWRHEFAQIMLRATDWNYTVVANLGGWTPQALEESYGKPPEETVKQWSEKYHLDIQVRA